MNYYVKQVYAVDWRCSMARYPCLVRKEVCKTKTQISFDTENIDDECVAESVNFKGMCNYQDRARTIFTPDKRTVEITGTVLIPGDACPKIPVISSGTATIFGVNRTVQEGKKCRNPDGTVNYTEVYLK